MLPGDSRGNTHGGEETDLRLSESRLQMLTGSSLHSGMNGKHQPVSHTKREPRLRQVWKNFGVPD